MFIDQEILVKKLSSVAPKLSDLGIKSVASFLDFKPSVVKALSDKDLLSVVLEEISRRNPEERCILRSFDETPVGLPSGMSAIGVNEFFDRHEEFTGKLEHPFTTSVFTKKIDTDIEMLQGDIFKLHYQAAIHVLADTVTQGVKLFRKSCANGAMCVDRSFTDKSTISGFDHTFEKFEDNRMDIIEKIRHSLAVIAGRKANVLDLKTVSDVAALLYSKNLKDYLKEARNKVLKAYELPLFLPKGFGGEMDEDKYSLDLYKLPKSWKKTAEIEDTTVYDIWNVLTNDVSRIEELKLLGIEEILKAHVKVASILKPVKVEDMTIAKKRNAT